MKSICKSGLTKNFGLQIVLFILIVSLMISCECVPDINTPKIISPENYSQAILINCSNLNDISVFSDEVEVISKLNNNTENFEYYKFWSGDRFVRVKDSQTLNTIQNFPVSFVNKQLYTIAFFNVGNKLKYIVAGDSLKSLKFNNFSHFKIINAIENNPKINLQIIENNQTIFNFNNLNNNISDYYPINYGIYTIKVLNSENSKLILEKNFDFQINSAYNLIISGNIENTLSTRIHKLNIPE